jgi:uncharacterized membrane protein required for colicin V production
MLFLALFLSSAALNALAKTSADFNNPKSLMTIIVFFFIWLVAYIALDLLLKLILKVVITITVLGPLDQFGGLLLGAFKGLLLCGIILQLILSFPVSANTREMILNAIPAKFSLATFQWAYPAAKKLQPYFDNLIKNETKPSVMDEINSGAKPDTNLSGEVDRMIKTNVPVIEKNMKQLDELMKEKELFPTAPQGQPR